MKSKSSWFILFCILISCISYCYKCSFERIYPLEFAKLEKKFKKEKEITFLVAGDPQFDMHDDFKKHRLMVSAMNHVMRAKGRDLQGNVTEGIWPSKTYDHSSTSFLESGDKIKKPAFLILTGDLTANSKHWELSYFRKFYENKMGAEAERFKEKIGYPIFLGLGNHDLENNSIKNYILNRMGNIKAKGYNFHTVSKSYSWEIGNFHFIQLHEYAGSSGHQELEWLKKDVEVSQKNYKKIILIQHYGLDDFSLCFDRPFGEPEETYSVENCRWWTKKDVETLQEIIRNKDVIALFSGHWHISGHCDWKVDKQRIPAFTSGGAKDTQNFLLVHLTNDYISVGNIQVDVSLEELEIYFSRFWMGEKQYDGSNYCHFKSDRPFSKKY